MNSTLQKWLPAVVFAMALGGTYMTRNTGLAVASGATPAAGPSLPTKVRHREESAFAKIHALLRAGDLQGARASLSELGERDPEAFFELLEKLPGIPGTEDLVKAAAAQLPWAKPEVTKLLNRIHPEKTRDEAWEAYTAARIGQIPDEEIFEVGSEAQTRMHLAGLRSLMEDAAEKRTDSFLAMLNKRGGTGIREEFFEMLMKHHPERADELFDTIPDKNWGSNYDKAYVLQVRARCLPTAENLIATLEDTSKDGKFSPTFIQLFTDQSYRHATPEEKVKILDTAASQPPLIRNHMADGVVYSDDSLSPTEFTQAIGLYASRSRQLEALEGWLGKQKAIDRDDRSWVEQLPNEKLRERANQLLDRKAAGAE